MKSHRKFRKISLTLGLVLIFAFTNKVKAQKHSSINSILEKTTVQFGGGVSYYNGELNGELYNINPKILHFAYRLGIDYQVLKNWQVGYSYLNGTLSGSDSYSKNAWVRNRNLDFVTDLSSHDFFVKYNLLKLEKVNYQIVIGSSFFTFSPEQLNVESNFKPTKLNSSVALNLGSELDFKLNKKWSVNAIVIYQQSFTDYIDATDFTKNSLDRYVTATIGLKYTPTIYKGYIRTTSSLRNLCPLF